jgi:hypothetical protein
MRVRGGWRICFVLKAERVSGFRIIVNRFALFFKKLRRRGSGAE